MVGLQDGCAVTIHHKGSGHLKAVNVVASFQ